MSFTSSAGSWKRWFRFCGLFGWCLAAASFAQTAQAGEVIVQLASGRVLRAEVDARTDSENLWLRFQTPTTSVLRPVAWHSIVSAEHQGTSLRVDELAELAPKIATAEPSAGAPGSASALERNPDPPAASYSVRQTSGGASGSAWAAVENPALQDEVIEVGHAEPPAITLPAPRITSVQIDAYLGQWDADVEPDGLVLHVSPQDQFGQLTPVTGSIQVELIGPRKRAFQDRPRGNGFAVEQLAYWSQPLSIDGFTPFGSVHRLPFQALHPEFDLDVSRVAVVHVRLVVPGQGTFEASQDGVRVRAYSPVRDFYERHTGKRFFPEERTGRGTRQ